MLFSTVLGTTNMICDISLIQDFLAKNDAPRRSQNVPDRG